MIGSDLEDDLSANQDKVLVLKDYRAKEFSHKVCAQQNYLGEQYKYEVPQQQSVDGGLVVELPAYIIHGQHFYPGIYQNLISPGFSVVYDKTGDTTERVRKFRDVMGERLKEERLDQTDAQLLKSHIRYRIFSPELLKKYLQ